MMTRLDNWPALLAAFIAQRRCMAFEWGSHDCCQFARAAVKTITGEDPAEDLLLGEYTSALGAGRVLAIVGALETIPEKCGLVECPIKRAGRGDIVLLEQVAEMPALGVCLGEKSAFPGREGLVFRPTLSCRRAWRV